MSKSTNDKVIELSEKYTKWVIEKVLLYGDAIPAWWDQEGCKLFFEWAKKQGIDYMAEDKK